MPTLMTDTLWGLPPEYMEQLLAAHQSAQSDEKAWSDPSTDESVRPGYSVVRGVAVIPVTGTLYRFSQDSIRQAFVAALADASVRAILFSVNSPGGVVAGTKELADFIAEARTKKRCAAYADGLCTSAAYWLASATGTVYAPETATIGSIGVVSVLCNTSKLNEKIGLSYTYITGGAWKAAGNGDTPLTDEERQYFQERITALHTLFKADVARHMGLTADPKAWGEAQILLAQPAKELGLVTEIVRDLDSAVAKLTVEAQMTREELAASSPELLNALLAEGKTNAEVANRESIAKAADDAVAGTLAVVKAVVGDGTCVKIETILSTCKAARMDAAQIAAIVPILVTASLGPAGRAVARDSAEFGLPELASGNMCSELEAGKEAQARAAMLAGIQNAHQQPVAATPGTEPTLSNPLLADAERRAKTTR